MRRPEEVRAGIAHEDARRVEVEGQEAEADAACGHGHQRSDVVAGQEAEPLQPDAVDGEGAAADRHHAGGQAVQAVDEVDGVGQRDDPRCGDERDDARREDEESGQRDLQLVHRHAAEVQDARREDLPGHLRRGRHVADVVDQPDGEHGARRQHDARHLGRVLEDRAQLRDGGRSQHRHHESHEHRGTAAVGDRLGVHRALAGVGDIANPQRDALGRDRDCGSGNRRNHQDQAVPADVGHASGQEIGIRREGAAQLGDLRPHRLDLPLVGAGLERAHDQVGHHLHLPGPHAGGRLGGGSQA